MTQPSSRARWNWLVLVTLAVALAGAWLSAEAGPAVGVAILRTA